MGATILTSHDHQTCHAIDQSWYVFDQLKVNSNLLCAFFSMKYCCGLKVMLLLPLAAQNIYCMGML